MVSTLYRPHSSRTFNESIVVVDRWVVDLDAADVVVVRVVGLQHVVSYVRDVLARVGFARDVHLPADKVKGLHEVLPKAHEIHRNVVLVLDRLRRPVLRRGEASSYRLVDPHLEMISGCSGMVPKAFGLPCS